jgi:hypothetical protein
MNPSIKHVVFLLVTGAVLVGACAPAPVPTQDPAEVQGQIEESVALTVAAQQAEDEQQAQAEPTNTPLPTQTEAGPPTPTSALATATPFVVVPPTLTPGSSSGGGGGGGGGVPPAPLEYDCTSRDRRPFDNTYFKPNKEFDISWTIINTGTKPWPAGFDVKYFSGPKISTSTFVELPAMDPGDSFEIILDGVAPQKEGFHVMTWMVQGQLCFPYVAIIVEK